MGVAQARTNAVSAEELIACFYPKSSLPKGNFGFVFEKSCSFISLTFERPRDFRDRAVHHHTVRRARHTVAINEAAIFIQAFDQLSRGRDAAQRRSKSLPGQLLFLAH
jgi:hypothetical protein